MIRKYKKWYLKDTWWIWIGSFLNLFDQIWFSFRQYCDIGMLLTRWHFNIDILQLAIVMLCQWECLRVSSGLQTMHVDLNLSDFPTLRSTCAKDKVFKDIPSMASMAFASLLSWGMRHKIVAKRVIHISAVSHSTLSTLPFSDCRLSEYEIILRARPQSFPLQLQVPSVGWGSLDRKVTWWLNSSHSFLVLTVDENAMQTKFLSHLSFWLLTPVG